MVVLVCRTGAYYDMIQFSNYTFEACFDYKCFNLSNCKLGNLTKLRERTTIGSSAFLNCLYHVSWMHFCIHLLYVSLVMVLWVDMNERDFYYDELWRLAVLSFDVSKVISLFMMDMFQHRPMLI